MISFLTLTDNWLDRVWRDTEMSERNFLHQTPTSAEETNQSPVVAGADQSESCGVDDDLYQYTDLSSQATVTIREIYKETINS